MHTIKEIMLNFKSKAAKFFAGALIALVFVGVSTANAAWMATTAMKITKASPKADVMWLQGTLNTLTGSTLVVDGLYGKKTTAAIKAFQVANPTSGKADGIAGKMTIAALNAKGSGTPGCTVNCTPAPQQTGPITAMLSTDNPAAGTVIQGQATADLLHVTFTGSGTVTQVTLQRNGISTSSDLTNVYLYDGGTRVADGASVNTNGVISFNGLSIPVSGMKTLSVKADYAALGTTGSVGVTMTSFMVSGSLTATTVSIAGNLMYIASAPATMASAVIGVVTPASGSTPTVNAGTVGYSFWSAPVQINGHQVALKSAAFRYIGSAPVDALSNIHLYVNGTPVGNVATVNNMNYVVFDLSAAPFMMNTGSSTVEVRADIQKGTNRTVQFSVQNGADLMVMDTQLNVNVAVTGVPASAGTITINGGSVTTSIDPTFSAMTNVTGGATNVAIAKFRLHSYGEDVKVTTLPISVNMNLTGGTPSGLNNVTLYFNGSQVGSAKSFTGTGTQALSAYQLGSSMIIPAGVDSTLEVRADIQSATNTNYTGGTVSVTLPLGSANGQGMNSLSTVNVPAAAITSNSLTAQTGTLTVAKSASYQNQVMNANTSNVKLGSFFLQNQSTSEGVRVTNLQVGVTFPAATTFTTAGSTTNVTTTQTWILNQTAALAGITAGNVLTLATNAGCSTLPVITVASVSGSTLTSVSSGQTASNVNTCTTGTAVVAAGTTVGPAVITNLSNLKTSETSGSGNIPINPTGTNNFSVNFTIAPGQSKTIDVWGDIGTANMGTVTTSLIATSLGANSNVSVLQNGTGTAVTGQVVTLATGGLGATPTVVANTTTTAQYIAGGTTTGVVDATKATFNVIATNGNATITEMKFKDTAGNGGITAVRVGSVTAQTSAGIAYLTNLAIPVANGGAGANVDAYASYSPVGASGITEAATGSITSLLQLCSIKYTIGNTTATLGDTTCGSPVTSSGQTMKLVASKPTVTVAQPVGSVVIPSSAIEAIDVTVAADAAGPITLVSIPINVNMTGPAATTANFTTADFVVKDVNNNIIGTATGGCGSTTACTNVTLTLNSTTGYVINAGTSQTFKVFVNTGAFTVPASPAVVALNTTIGGTGTFSWIDTAGSATSAGTFTGVAPAGNVYNYPNTTTSVVHN